MTAIAVPYISQTEYLIKERIALDKHEYYKGAVYAMSGASFAHNIIQSNCQGF